MRREGGGFAVEGRGLYVWEPNRSEAIRTALELRNGTRGARSAARFLLIENHRRRRLGPDPEALDA